MNDDHTAEWELPEGHVLVKCPSCDYTNDVPEGKALDKEYVAEHCERCALPSVERVTIKPAFQPFDPEVEEQIIEHSVASATQKVMKDVENNGKTDVNLAEIGVMIARETMDTTFHVMAAEREYLRAADAVKSRRESSVEHGGADGGAGMVEASDGGEPHRDGADAS